MVHELWTESKAPLKRHADVRLIQERADKGQWQD